MTRTPLPPLAVSLGDPAGIGPEVVAKCWDHRDRLSLPPFIAIGDPRSLAAVWDGPIATIDDPREADSAFDLGLPILPLAAAQADVPGVPSVAGAHCSLDSLEIAVGLARSGSASAVVTGTVRSVGPASIITTLAPEMPHRSATNSVCPGWLKPMP